MLWRPSAALQLRPSTPSARSVSGPDDAQLAHRRRAPRRALASADDVPPVRDRVLVERHGRREDEVLVLGERHLGVLRVRVGRQERPAPAHLPRRDALPAAVCELALRGELACVAARGRPARASACSISDQIVAIASSASISRQSIGDDVLELLLEPSASSSSSRPSSPRRVYAWRRRRARRGESSTSRGEASARRSGRPGPAEPERVADDEVGEPRDTGIGHRLSYTRLTRGRIASSKRPGPERTGSSAGRPVSSAAASIAARAPSSSRRRVLSASATTLAGRARSAMRSCSSTSSESERDREAPGSSSMCSSPTWWQRTRRAARSRGSGRA